MTNVQGESWEELTHKAALSLENANRFLAFLQADNYGVAQNMGKLVIADAALGNDDRIGFVKHFKRLAMNPGNIMFSNNRMVLIDSDAMIGDLSKTIGSKEGAFKSIKYDLVNSIFDHKEQYASSFAEKHIPEQLDDGKDKGDKTVMGGFDVRPHYNAWLQDHKDAMKAAFINGMESGMWQLSVLRSDKEAMGEMRQEVMTHGEGEEQSLWSTFKARARYIGAREGGMHQDMAMFESQLYFDSKVSNGNEVPTPEAGEIDPDALNIDAPTKRSKRKKFSLARRFGKRNKSRKQKKRARRLVESDIHKLNVLDDNRVVKPLNIADKLLNDDVFNTKNRKDRGAREVTFLHNAGVLAFELQKKEADIRQQYKYIRGLGTYLNFKERQTTRETTVARQRFNAYVAANTFTKLEVQTQQLEEAVARALPSLGKHNPALAQKLTTSVESLRNAMDELSLVYQLAWDTVTEMELAM